MRKQYTLAKAVEFQGKGLHSGKIGTIRLKPAPENTGLVFIYNGKGEKHFIPYTVENVVDTQNNIAVSDGRVVIKTVEHLTAALYGTQIDNCMIEIDTTEVPIMDGSSQEFVNAILSAGRVAQDADKEVLRIVSPVWATIDDKFLVALPSDKLKLSYTINFPNSPIGTQAMSYEFDSGSFTDSISKARTFGFVEDFDTYRKNGLVLGGGFENVQVFSKKENRSITPPRYDDEPVRHKILDLLGALAIFNFDIKAFIISFKGGHTLDIEFAKRVKNLVGGMKKEGSVYRPAEDPSYYFQILDMLGLDDNLPS